METQPHLTPEAAFIQGQKARRRGEDLDANPYEYGGTNERLHARWRDGWVEEDSITDD